MIGRTFKRAASSHPVAVPPFRYNPAMSVAARFLEEPVATAAAERGAYSRFWRPLLEAEEIRSIAPAAGVAR